MYHKLGLLFTVTGGLYSTPHWHGRQLWMKLVPARTCPVNKLDIYKYLNLLEIIAKLCKFDNSEMLTHFSVLYQLNSYLLLTTWLWQISDWN